VLVLEIRCQTLLEEIQTIWGVAYIFFLLSHYFTFNVYMVVFLFNTVINVIYCYVLLYVYAAIVYLCSYCMFIYSLYVYVSLRLP
jgi:hypothetical protein